jgi:hypothetical protein
MDYWPWSDALMLEALAEAAAQGFAEPASLRRAAQALVADLAHRVQPDGGWGYYQPLGAVAERSPPISMSFTTAAALLALRRAGALGADVPEALLQRATAALTAMRNEDGWFAYWSVGARPVLVGRNDRLGASGRGPVCDLALLRAGAGSAEGLSVALEHFLEGSTLLDAERGKVLMHAGPDGQGCHYLLFDHLHAALAHATLPAHEAQRVRLTELLLAYRQTDGSFLDTPILGPSYGTAAALLALRALAPR